MNPIITSLLDTDLYKLTMMQCIWHHFKDAHAQYRFQCRNEADLGLITEQVKIQAQALCDLKFTRDELAYLAQLPYFKSDFIEMLSQFKLNFEHLDIQHNPNLSITIAGPWYQTILFEVPLLAIVNESYYQHRYPDATWDEGQKRLAAKIKRVDAFEDKAHFYFSDFGTRRRFSKAWQEQMLRTMKDCTPQMIGTSNVYFAQLLGLKPIGTMAHEYLQAGQVLAPHIESHQAYALQIWRHEYQDHLSIALTDALTMDAFLNEFNAELAQQYQGLRQDSGDPIVWGEKALAHYQKLNIDARNKTFVFSDGLDFAKAFAIHQYFKNRCLPVFGIGTYLTNDMGFEKNDIVIKLFEINERPVVKISDTPGKLVASHPKALADLKRTYNIKDH